MTVQTLTPTQDVADGAAINITALLTTPTQTTLQFQNTGRERLIVVPGASAETVTVDIEELIEGQSVSAFPSVTLDGERLLPVWAVPQRPGDPGDLPHPGRPVDDHGDKSRAAAGHRSLLGPRLSPRSRPA